MIATSEIYYDEDKLAWRARVLDCYSAAGTVWEVQLWRTEMLEVLLEYYRDELDHAVAKRIQVRRGPADPGYTSESSSPTDDLWRSNEEKEEREERRFLIDTARESYREGYMAMHDQDWDKSWGESIMRDVLSNKS